MCSGCGQAVNVPSVCVDMTVSLPEKRKYKWKVSIEVMTDDIFVLWVF